MRLAELRPGWRTDFILHRQGATIVERDDCLVVRTPDNPSYYWGNCLVLPAAPLDDECAHWCRRFHDEVAALQPDSLHLAIGVNAPYLGQSLPAWVVQGFELNVTEVMRLAPGELIASAKPARGAVAVRPIDFARESGAIVDLECADPHGFEPEGYRRYRQRQFERYARMHAAGLAQWFGLWCDGVLAASCGLMREAAAPQQLARFQHVVTHPQWRRRGLCTALIHAVSRYGLEQWQAQALIMVADPDDVAIGIYRSLGFRAIDSEWCLQRYAPQDRPA